MVMIKRIQLILVFMSIIFLSSCGKDDDANVSTNTVNINGSLYDLNGGILYRKIEWQGDRYFRAFDMILYGGGIKRTASTFRGKGIIIVARMYVIGSENYMDDGHYVFGVTPKPITFSRVGYATNFDVASNDNDPLIPLDSGFMNVRWENQHTIDFDIRNNNGDVLIGSFYDDMIIR